MSLKAQFSAPLKPFQLFGFSAPASNTSSGTPALHSQPDDTGRDEERVTPPALPSQQLKRSSPHLRFDAWLHACLFALALVALGPSQALAAEGPGGPVPIAVMVAGVGLAIS